MASVLFPLALGAVSLISMLAVMLQKQQQTGGDTGSQALCCTSRDAPAWQNCAACQHPLWMQVNTGHRQRLRWLCEMSDEEHVSEAWPYTPSPNFC